MAACGAVSSSISQVPASGTPRPLIDTKAELVAYVAERSAALIAQAAERPNEVVRSAVTFARPLAPAEVDALLSAAGVNDNYYLVWVEPGTDVTGGVDRAQLQSVLADHPGLRVTYLNTEASLVSLVVVSRDERIWLVDVDGTENYYALAESTGLLR